MQSTSLDSPAVSHFFSRTWPSHGHDRLRAAVATSGEAGSTQGNVHRHRGCDTRRGQTQILFPCSSGRAITCRRRWTNALLLPLQDSYLWSVPRNFLSPLQATSGCRFATRPPTGSLLSAKLSQVTCRTWVLHLNCFRVRPSFIASSLLNLGLRRCHGYGRYKVGQSGVGLSGCH